MCVLEAGEEAFALDCQNMEEGRWLPCLCRPANSCSTNCRLAKGWLVAVGRPLNTVQTAETPRSAHKDNTGSVHAICMHD